MILAWVLVIGCGSGADKEYARITRLLDESMTQLGVKVIRADDEPVIECGRYSLRSGRKQRARRLFIEIAPLPQSEVFAQRLRESWKEKGFSVDPSKANRGSSEVLVLVTHDKNGSELSLIGYPAARRAYVLAKTGCR